MSTIDRIKTSSPLQWLIVYFIFLAPVFAVHIIPATDLPQHLHQIYLLKDRLFGHGDTADIYQINYFSPGTLFFWIGLVFSFILPSGWLLAKLLALLPLTMHFLVGYRYFRHHASGLTMIALSGILLFSPSFYWGFFNYLIGWPLFLFYVAELDLAHNRPLKFLRALLLLSLLYLAHSFWFAAAVAITILLALLRQISLINLKAIALALVPLGVLSILWLQYIHHYRQTGFDLAPYWPNQFWQRLSPTTIVTLTVGGMWRWLATLIATALLIWHALILKTRRQHRAAPIWLWSAVLFIAWYLILPDKFLNSIYFSARWLPFVFACLMLSLAHITLPASFRHAALTIILVFSLTTATVWKQFEGDELNGLQSALTHIEKPGRLLGLAYLGRSHYLNDMPFLQMFAYSAIYGIREFNFSFVEHGSSIISYQKPYHIEWTPGLEWFPQHVQLQDLVYFDYILVQSRGDEHAIFSQLPDWKPCSEPALWRLYCRVTK